MAQVTITQGRDFEYDIFLQNEDGSPKNITGFSLIKMRKKDIDDGIKEFFNPLTAAVNEVQALAYSADPASGTFKLQHPTSGEKTATINFNDNAATIETKLRALKVFSALIVTGTQTQAGGIVINYAGNDGGRDQDLLAVTDATTLKDAGSALVVVTPSTTTPGVSAKGIDVIEEKAGHLRLKGGEDDAAALKEDLDQTGVLVVRIGAQDLNIPPIKNLYDVIADPLA